MQLFPLFPVQLLELEFSSQSLNPKMLESSAVFGVGLPLPSSCMRNPLNPWISMSCSIPDPATFPFPFGSQDPEGSFPAFPPLADQRRAAPTGTHQSREVERFRIRGIRGYRFPVPGPEPERRGESNPSFPELIPGPKGAPRTWRRIWAWAWSDGKRANGFQLEEGRVRWDMGREFPAQHSLPTVVPVFRKQKDTSGCGRSSSG